MNNNHPSADEWGRRILVALLFTTIAGLIMIVFSPWVAKSVISKMDDYLAKIGVSLLLLAAAIMVRSSKPFEKYWQVLFALFILTITLVSAN